jgi:hypothetical protein
MEPRIWLHFTIFNNNKNLPFLGYSNNNPHAPINLVLKTKISRQGFYLAKSIIIIWDLHTTVYNDQDQDHTL